MGASLRAAVEAATYAWIGCGITWILRLAPVPRWHALVGGGLASGLICAAIRWRAVSREAGELKRFAETARRGLDGDWEELRAEATCGELRYAAGAVEELLRAEEAERQELSAKIAGLEEDVRQVTEETAQRIADLEHAATAAARDLRESALMVHATANLLARDSAGRLDATGRERLEQLRLNAEAVDQRLREWIDDCCANESLRARDSMMGVVTSGNNGDGPGGMGRGAA